MSAESSAFSSSSSVEAAIFDERVLELMALLPALEFGSKLEGDRQPEILTAAKVHATTRNLDFTKLTPEKL